IWKPRVLPGLRDGCLSGRRNRDDSSVSSSGSFLRDCVRAGGSAIRWAELVGSCEGFGRRQDGGARDRQRRAAQGQRVRGAATRKGWPAAGGYQGFLSAGELYRAAD